MFYVFDIIIDCIIFCFLMKNIMSFWVEWVEYKCSDKEHSGSKFVLVGTLNMLTFDFPNSFFKRKRKLPIIIKKLYKLNNKK